MLQLRPISSPSTLFPVNFGSLNTNPASVYFFSIVFREISRFTIFRGPWIFLIRDPVVRSGCELYQINGNKISYHSLIWRQKENAASFIFYLIKKKYDLN